MKKTLLLLLSLCLFTSGWGKSVSKLHAPQLGKNSIDEVLKAMTLEEKAELLVGGSYEVINGNKGRTLPEATIGAAGMTKAIPRLGIPCTVLTDGPAGVRISPTRKGGNHTYYATGNPVGTLVASSWDTECARSVGENMGNEVLEYGCDVLLAPGMCLHRNPLCGRNFEYFSEDPVLSGVLSGNEIIGVQSYGVGTSAKHFICNNQETYRTQNNSIVGQRALRELYLKNFELAIKIGNPWTIMSSYNLLNGSYTQADKALLCDWLRGELGYKGIVMTDWTERRNTVNQVIAENDLMEWGLDTQVHDIINAVKSGKLSIDIVNRNVRNILNYIVKTPHFRHYQASNVPDLKAHATVAREMAAQGIVLLKNDHQTLPLVKNQKIALFGVGSYKGFLANGWGSGDVNKPYVVNIYEGLKNAGYQIDDNLSELYEDAADDINFGSSYAKHRALVDDIAIMTIRRNAGEGSDRHNAQGDWSLTSGELNSMKNIADAFHSQGKKFLVILNIGGVIETASWKNLPDAILLPWQPGEEGGNAIADIISGKVCPSGHLPMTFPLAYDDIPSSKNFPQNDNGGVFDKNKSTIGYTNYDEGIWIGYRYFDTFAKPVSYPFGYGLSYTTFSFTGLKAQYGKSVCKVVVTVRNTGNIAGKEVAQLYVSAPKSIMEKPKKELKAFAKTRILRPGESQTLTLRFRPIDLASFNEKENSWVLDSGVYQIMVGESVQNIKVTTPMKVAKGVQKKVPTVL
ncbi:glycoside hydrolase family 3 C-terminal domain-containing protein [Prevotella cerevisiae]|uniref:Glycoside hydrolase family 3 C-terminal domain-containing protein n=1 Tax=Segatella cerevisiae TaxID=2053716 RepID=A0ABT1BX79_9BACT|nr:glycoside hydrolase family 3 C-terminal domain-containing protein [Segatella cerevisiae]MCO6025661.1 glycoside hydrolase family 3 C-terminal domain-containing protein [Segatella cerevisiae]